MIKQCANMQREIQQLKSGSRGGQGQQQQSLVSLDSWSQGGNDSASGSWDAFSNQPEASREAASQAPAGQPSAMSPLSPQRQAAAAQAQAFIRTQASNVQSMQVATCWCCFCLKQKNLKPMNKKCLNAWSTSLMIWSCYSVLVLGMLVLCWCLRAFK